MPRLFHSSFLHMDPGPPFHLCLSSLYVSPFPKVWHWGLSVILSGDPCRFSRNGTWRKKWWRSCKYSGVHSLQEQGQGPSNQAVPGPQNVCMRACVISCSVVSDYFVTPGTVACQTPLFMGFSRQEYWIALLCPPAGDPSDPGIEPRSPAMQANSLLLKHLGNPGPWIYLNRGAPGHSGHSLGFLQSPRSCELYPVYSICTTANFQMFFCMAGRIFTLFL